MNARQLLWLRGRNTVDPVVLDWRARVIAGGGTASFATLWALHQFVMRCRVAGIWDKLTRLNLFCGDQLAAALVPLKVGGGSATETNVNFVSGDYTEAMGLTGNGSTKYLNTGFVASSVHTNASAHMAAYVGGDFYMGASTTPPDYFLLFLSGTTMYGFMGDDSPYVSATIPALTGFMAAAATSDSDQRVYRNGAQVGATGGGARTGSLGGAFAVYVFGRNSGGSITNLVPGPCKGYSIGSGLTVEEVGSYNTIMEQFQDALGRGVQ